MSDSYIGKRLKEYRLSIGLNGKQFAEIIGISQSSLSEIETGKNKPSADTISLIVRHTDINPVWILTGEGSVCLSVDKQTPDIVTEKILQLLEDMEEDKRRDVLKYCEKEKLLTELLKERKKRGEAA